MEHLKSMLSLEQHLFGDLTPQEGDVLPSVVFEGVRYEKNRRIPTSVRPRKQKPVRLPGLGRAVSLPAPEPVVEESDELGYVEIDIPESNGAQPRYMPPPEIENEIEVPQDVLSSLDEALAEKGDDYRIALFELATSLFAFDDASNFVEVAMRDGMNLDIELDKSVLEAFRPLTQLNILNKTVQTLSLNDKLKATLMERLVTNIADDITKTLSKRVPEGIAHMRQYYAAKLAEGNVPEDGEPVGNPLGVRVSRR